MKKIALIILIIGIIVGGFYIATYKQYKSETNPELLAETQRCVDAANTWDKEHLQGPGYGMSIVKYNTVLNTCIVKYGYSTRHVDGYDIATYEVIDIYNNDKKLLQWIGNSENDGLGVLYENGVEVNTPEPNIEFGTRTGILWANKN